MIAITQTSKKNLLFHRVPSKKAKIQLGKEKLNSSQ